MIRAHPLAAFFLLTFALSWWPWPLYGAGYLSTHLIRRHHHPRTPTSIDVLPAAGVLATSAGVVVTADLPSDVAM
jgi:hypothetical protein